MIWSIGSFRSASLSRQGEHTQQWYTQAHAHSLQKNIDPDMAEATTLASPSLLDISVPC